ncbi:MAG: 2-hydroxymuconate tautomerase [Candidatus Kryptonium sp.]|nr:4-oxalocrotonate tautomerase family protein [Candidatus Kryptonium sp.]MCX7762771.1 4-oxalocrotonate tautomerase family protein [Candidatus Kryptonium sp.]MDW8108027.1 2-hydroxymuconate tautomerase [Candidatus Kryptonium sp.]
MPIVIINMLEGRSSEMKRDLIKKVTDAVVESLGVNPESVRVIINEVPKENFAVAGLPIEEYRQKKQDGISKMNKKANKK